MLTFLHNVKKSISAYAIIFTSFLLGLTLTTCSLPEQSPLPTLGAVAPIPPTRPANAPAEAATAIPPTFTPEITPVTAIPTPTISITATQTESPQPAATPEIYIVQAGDTLLGIAIALGVDYEDLLQINGIEDPETLYVGDQLIRPPHDYYQEPAGIVRYQVKEGESFASIAAKFGVPQDVLQNANLDVTPTQLQIGQELLVPWNGIHVVAPGETLSHIAFRYNVTYDALVRENGQILDFENLDFLQAGAVLLIPRDNIGEIVAEGYDCSPQQQARTEVITYTVQAGEELYCLASKFNLADSTILYANESNIAGGRMEPGLQLRIPPANGALYTITAADIANEVTLADIVRWYGIRAFNSVVDWQGNAVQTPLAEGQTLFLLEADPLAGQFQSAEVIAFTQLNNSATANTANTPIPNISPQPEPPAPGVPAIPPSTTGLSSNITRFWTDKYATDSPGYCPYLTGFGWSGALMWPVNSRAIRENRDFHPGHKGIDIEVPEGTPVVAAQSGTVIWAGYSSFGGGIIVVMAHGGGWRTVYAHLSELQVACGREISQGSQIGLSGKTGTSFYHLHFAVDRDSDALNPLDYLP